MTSIPRHPGARLRRSRTLKGLTLTEAADRLRMPAMSLLSVELGCTNLQWATSVFRLWTTSQKTSTT